MTKPKPGIWDTQMAVESPLLQQLYTLWLDKRRGNLLPARADFDPMEMRDCLGSLFIVETVPDIDDFRYRLIGIDITRASQRDSTGKLISEVFGDIGLALYRKVRDERLPIRVYGPLDWLGRDFIGYETIILPLADDGREVNRFIGGMVFQIGPQ
ncbi:MAG: PAS domain-containing protein [Alphaproteobacteria bacterium]|nr:PAS domain-containing protein [Alphaproteobacteria bacterium]MBU0795710.1 PAS domain-containing protein [Alphaproteobacteria bacterium]MBU0887333.1 PAS domain-containing protein [Alphaproteobacteria bacterium]MBU1811786.1 PAS domain-containing protein [Alphaproteobacteria bacterium]MBU2091077.1 PAS domain-containing protein [Alphaproteobacteria bacterium]